MAEVPLEILKALKEYIAELSENIPVSSAILFGSYATGTYTKESDIDIAIFSNDFSNTDRINAGAFLLKKSRKFKLDIQPLPFGSEELNNKDRNPFIKQILKTGIQIG